MAALLIGVMLATMIGSSLGGNSIEALFFARFGVEFLPYMYMALGVTTLLTTLAITALLGKFSHERLYILLPAVLAGLLIGGRVLLALNVSWAYPVLWLGKEVLNTVIGLFSWGLAGLACDTRQAKRLFPLFGAGRILGAVLGGLGTQPLVNWLSTENLLLIWAGAMLITFVLTQALLRQRAAIQPTMRKSRRSRQAGTFQAFITEVQQGYQFVRRSTLMRWMSIAAVLFSVLYFSIALPFSRAATEQFKDEAALAGFLGLFQGLSTAVAFLASLFVANRLFARFGIVNAVLAFPALYVVGFGSLIALAAFPVVVAFRFAQMVWLSGIADSAYQVLFNVVPAERRDQVRAFIGGVPGQAGIVIAGAILIIGEQALQPQQLYLIGLIAAGLTLFVFWRIKGAYGQALADALRAGQPQLFFSEEEPFGGFQRDAAAVKAAVAGLADPDPIARRVSAEILGHLSVPEAMQALVNALQDPEASVRAASLRALACARATPALLDVAACLRDPEPEVRVQAVDTLRQLAGYAAGLIANIRPLMEDPDPLVRAQTALALLMASPPTPSPSPLFRPLRDYSPGERGGVAKPGWGVRAEARDLLRNMVVMGDLDARVSALNALGEWGDAEAFELVCMELEDRPAPPAVRRAAATALARIDPARSILQLVRALDDEDRSVRKAVAEALGRLGPMALEPALTALSNPALERGALLALQRLPVSHAAAAIRAYAQASVARATRYHDLFRAVATTQSDDPAQLLAEALRDKAHSHGLNALQAVGLLRERETIDAAIDGLKSNDAARRANALETLEAVGEAPIIKPLVLVWESAEAAPSSANGALIERLLHLLDDADAWVRACAALVARRSADPLIRAKLARLAEADLDPSVRATAALALNGDSAMDTLPTLSLMERILFLRRVPLFAGLSPADLKQVAGIAGEQFFTDGEVIAEQGEPGEEMYIIVTGEIRVLKAEGAEFARREPGEYVGEMAIISQEPRMASLSAVGEVRTLCIDRRQFEGLLRERPETSLAVMRVLCQRLKEATK